MRTVVLIAIIAAVAAGCAGTASLQSSAPTEPVRVDAQLLEWGGRLNEVGRDGLSVGVQNDDEYLYVSLSTRDPSTVGRIMHGGLIVWIDPQGGKSRTFGIRFPLGYAREEGDAGLAGDLAANRVRIERSTQELEVIGENGHAVRHRKDSVPGLLVEVEADQRVLTYELRLPLAIREGVLYAARVQPGDQIGIGFTSRDLVDMNLAQQPGSGGLPGGRMSSADGRSRYDPRMAGFTPEPLNQWIAVTLADAE